MPFHRIFLCGAIIDDCGSSSADLWARELPGGQIRGILFDIYDISHRVWHIFVSHAVGGPEQTAL